MNERLDSCLSIRSGRLWIEECDTVELARRFGTPLYVVSEDQLRRTARAFAAAYSQAWPEGPVRILPSIKANLTLALRRILSEEGLGCDAFGAPELEAALRGGVPPELISLGGPAKSPELLERAIALGVRIALDSPSELGLARAAARQAGREARVRFRIRPDLSRLKALSDLFGEAVSIAEAAELYKPGIPTEFLPELIREASSAPEVAPVGVTVHLPRHGRDPALWSELARATVAVLAIMRKAAPGWEPQELDFGGGFPMPRDPTGRGLPDRGEREETAPAVDEYARALTGSLREALRAAGIEPKGKALEIEPGRSLYGDAGIHLATVLNVKRQSVPQARAWIETDTSELFIPDLLFEHSRWPLVVATRASETPIQRADVVGKSCNFDILDEAVELPKLEPGDVLAFLDTGAYQDAGASNFNALSRPATVLVLGSDAEIVKRAETIDDVFSRDVVPQRLADGGTSSVRRLDHVSVTVGDLDRSLGFYNGLLGIPVLERGESVGGPVAEITGFPDARVFWADLGLPGNQVLELLEYASPRGEQRDGGTNDPGSAHMSLRVDDAAAVHGRLVEAGVAVRSSPVLIEDDGDWNGVRCFYALDPDGFTVEILERPDGGP
jgi:diaminopimelate decarboxylase